MFRCPYNRPRTPAFRTFTPTDIFPLGHLPLGHSPPVALLARSVHAAGMVTDKNNRPLILKNVCKAKFQITTHIKAINGNRLIISTITEMQSRAFASVCVL